MTIFYQTGQETHVTRGDLPHWTQYGKMHFVTFRLADSLPQEKVKQLINQRQEWISCHKEPYTEAQWVEYYKLFTERVERWLDAGHGECLLSQNQYANVVAQAIRYFDRQRYFLDRWVVMPNHVHVLLIPIKPYSLKKILHSWKSFTSNEINKLRGQTGELWQHESFDHIVRSHAQLEKYRDYVIENWQKSNEMAILSRQKIDSSEWPKHLASE
jgi:REP element-mobilizing transposase RayT